MHYRLGSISFSLNSIILVQTYEGLFCFVSRTLLLKERYPNVNYTKILRSLEHDGHFVIHKEVDHWNIYKYDSEGIRTVLHTGVEKLIPVDKEIKS